MYRILIFVLSFLILACDEQTQERITVDDLLSDYSSQSYRTLEDSKNFVKLLQSEIENFYASPDEVKFNNCRTYWEHARVAWSQAEAFLYYDSLNLDNILNRINGSVEGGSDILDIIENQSDHSIESIESYSNDHKILGFHSIEFLLWGTETDSDPNLSGQLTWDILAESENRNKELAFFRSVLSILIDDISELQFKQLNPFEVFKFYEKRIKSEEDIKTVIFPVLRSFTNKLLDQRLKLIYETKNVGLEESPFSDFSLSDLRFNIIGIESILTGDYNDTEGEVFEYTSISDFVNVDSKLQLISEIKIILSNIESPLDARILLGDRDTEIEELINKLEQLAGELNEDSNSI